MAPRIATMSLSSDRLVRMSLKNSGFEEDLTDLSLADAVPASVADIAAKAGSDACESGDGTRPMPNVDELWANLQASWEQSGELEFVDILDELNRLLETGKIGADVFRILLERVQSEGPVLIAQWGAGRRRWARRESDVSDDFQPLSNAHHSQDWAGSEWKTRRRLSDRVPVLATDAVHSKCSSSGSLPAASHGLVGASHLGNAEPVPQEAHKEAHRGVHPSVARSFSGHVVGAREGLPVGAVILPASRNDGRSVTGAMGPAVAEGAAERLRNARASSQQCMASYCGAAPNAPPRGLAPRCAASAQMATQPTLSHLTKRQPSTFAHPATSRASASHSSGSGGVDQADGACAGRAIANNDSGCGRAANTLSRNALLMRRGCANEEMAAVDSGGANFKAQCDEGLYGSAGARIKLDATQAKVAAKAEL